MACAIFYTHQTSCAYAGMCACDCTHQMEKTEDFESFLLPLQTGEPMIHQLFPSMCKLLNDIQSKFIKKKKLSSDLESNI